MTDLVSIAISTYEANGNGPEFLTRNLKNIIKQTYQNIEVVISDHSSDNSIKEVCKKFSSQKYPIKYVHNPHHKGNISQNINNAIKYCNGVYIKILFMDDYLFHDNVIQEIVNEFKKQSEKKWLVHSYIHTKNHRDFYYLHHPRFSHDITFSNRIGCPSCLTIHKSVSERFDVNIKWFMDGELYFRINAEHGPPIFLHNSKPYMVNVHHENQVTNKDINNSLIKKETIFIRNKYTRTRFYGSNIKIIQKNNIQNILFDLNNFKKAIIFGKGPTLVYKNKDEHKDVFFVCINNSINHIKKCDLLVCNDIETFDNIEVNHLINCKNILIPFYIHKNGRSSQAVTYLDVKNKIQPYFNGNLIIYNILYSRQHDYIISLNSYLTSIHTGFEFIASFLKSICDINFYGFAKANETKREVNLYDDNSNETKHLTQYKNYIQHIEMINNFYRGGEIKYKLN
tara:strand:- start:738 stop:2099 length:1362 start_codon:yes stop_codon:yes gene_type:complete